MGDTSISKLKAEEEADEVISFLNVASRLPAA